MPLPSNPVAGAYIAISPPTIDDAQVVPPCPGNAVAAHSRWGASAQLKPLAVFDGSLHGPDGTGGVSMGALESAEFHRISRRKSRFDPGANTSGNRPRRCWLRRPPLCSPCWPCPRGDGPSHRDDRTHLGLVVRVWVPETLSCLVTQRFGTRGSGRRIGMIDSPGLGCSGP